MAIAQLLRNAGAEVIYLGRFQLPTMLVAAALDEDADLIGMSCHSWEYIGYTRELLEMLRDRGAAVPVVLGGSVITEQDARVLMDEGVAGVFGPGTPTDSILDSIAKILDDDTMGTGTRA